MRSPDHRSWSYAAGVHTQFSVRAAVPTDAEAIAEIHNSQGVATTASYALTPGTATQRREWIVHQKAADRPVLVAENADGTVVGFADYDSFRALAGYDHTAEVSVYTAPGNEHRGIGSALMTVLLTHARRSGMHAMVSLVDADNTASINFHKNFGFRIHGLLPQLGRKFDRWLDVVVLIKLLDDKL